MLGQYLGNTEARLCRHGNDSTGLDAVQRVQLPPHALDVGVRKIYFVDNWHYRDASGGSGKVIGYCLSLNTLAGIDNQHNTLAGVKTARYLQRACYPLRWWHTGRRNAKG